MNLKKILLALMCSSAMTCVYSVQQTKENVQQSEEKKSCTDCREKHRNQTGYYNDNACFYYSNKKYIQSNSNEMEEVLNIIGNILENNWTVNDFLLSYQNIKSEEIVEEFRKEYKQHIDYLSILNACSCCHSDEIKNELNINKLLDAFVENFFDQTSNIFNKKNIENELEVLLKQNPTEHVVCKTLLDLVQKNDKNSDFAIEMLIQHIKNNDWQKNSAVKIAYGYSIDNPSLLKVFLEKIDLENDDIKYAYLTLIENKYSKEENKKKASSDCLQLLKPFLNKLPKDFNEDADRYDKDLEQSGVRIPSSYNPTGKEMGDGCCAPNW